MYLQSEDRELDDIPSRLLKLVPKQTQDVLATGIFLVVFPISFLIYVFAVLPIWFPSFSEEWNTRVFVLMILASNVYLNWYKMVRTGANGNKSVLVNVVKQGYRYCHTCQANVPPRAYHCPICDECQFRRDHHCSFGAICVGHFNQRYFVAAITNMFFLVASLVYYSWHFLWLQMDGDFTVLRIWQLMLPHLALIARFISFYQFTCCVFFGSTLTVLLFTSYMVAAQFFCLWRGQTRVEYLLDIHSYQLGLLGNLKETLGTRWPLALLSPFIPSPLPSDGTHFQTRQLEAAAASKDL